MFFISLLVSAISLLIPLSASTAAVSSSTLPLNGISLTTTTHVVPSPSSSLTFNPVTTQDLSSVLVVVSVSDIQTSSVSPSPISLSSSTTFSPAGRPGDSTNPIAPSTSSLFVSASASPAGRPGDSTNLITPSISSLFVSASASPAGKPGDSTNLNAPSTSSLFVSASASPGANPCGKNNGGCAHYCGRNGSEYICSCSTGFRLKSDRHGCTDIDECNSTSGGHKCAHICVNTVGSFACACRAGYKLETDGLTCKKVLKTSPTDKATSDNMGWDWLVLGVVIGAVALAILCLILGIILKRATRNQGKENISSQEMTGVKTTSSMAATNPVAIGS